MDVSLRRFGLRTGVHEAWTGLTEAPAGAELLND
jgi:hypothetical protein